MDEVASLKLVPIFSYMDENEIAGIRALMDRFTYEPGQVIMQEGEPGDLFYVVIQGHAQVLIQDASGQELDVHDIGPGSFFGELSMLTGEPRLARVKALDEVIALALDRTEFFTFLQLNPHAAIDVLTELGQQLHRTDKLLRQSVSRNVNEVVEEQYTLGQRIADLVADTMGSWPFIIFQTTLLGIWIILNVTAWVKHWDPYPFILLNLALSFQAAYAAPFIMMSQNRQAMKDRVAAEVDHQVNTKAELEIGLLMHRLDDLERALLRHLQKNT